MRITQNMMSTIFMSNLRKQTEAMLQRQEQIATQKRINRPSDDPSGMGRVLAGRSTLAAIGQYTDNIKQGRTRLEFSENTLKLVDDLVQQARRIAEEKSGGEVTADERQFAATRIKEIFDQVLQLANSKFGDRYMFSGDKTSTQPFTVEDPGEPYTVSYQGDDGSFRYPIADGVEVTVDADGRSYFQNSPGGGVNIFDELRDLIAGLENTDLADGSTQIRATVDPLEDAHVQIMNKRSEAGPKLYRFQATEEHWVNMKNTVQAAIGREEDIDVTQAIIELKNLETAYQSTMAAASRIIQPSLVNFLK
jgi:flagellar hook-associated protein 3 FlgL